MMQHTSARPTELIWKPQCALAPSRAPPPRPRPRLLTPTVLRALGSHVRQAVCTQLCGRAAASTVRCPDGEHRCAAARHRAARVLCILTTPSVPRPSPSCASYSNGQPTRRYVRVPCAYRARHSRVTCVYRPTCALLARLTCALLEGQRAR